MTPPPAVRTLAEDVGCTEGPVVRGDGEVVFVSMDRGLIYAVRDGATRVLADVGFYPNGATEGSDGTIYVAQVGKKFAMPPAKMRADREGTGGVQAVRRSGEVRWITRDPISPNDICLGPDGLLYVTDPTRGTRDDARLWRCDPVSGEAELLRSVPWLANGIGFGPDDALYVADSRNRRIVRYALDGGKLGAEEPFAQLERGVPDGFAFDIEGNLIVAAAALGEPHPADVQIYDRNGKLAGAFAPGTNRLYTNVALSAGRVLYITDTDGGRVLAVPDWPSAGLPLHPFRTH